MTTTDDIRSVEQLLDRIAQGLQPEYLFFWGHRPNKDGSVGKGCFSQWFETAFTVDGTRYATAEHFMMAGKARLFGDDDTLQKILAAPTPDAAKRLGRRIKPFDEARWQQARFDIVVQGNEAKFRQHPALGAYLLDTGDRVLVEASPVDAVWGIGLAATDSKAADLAQWAGLNLLGFALMEVRSRLRAPTS